MGAHQHGFAHEDPVINRPRALEHVIDLEPFITCRANDISRWFAPDDDTGRLNYVSRDWVGAWLTRCGYFGLRQRLT